MASSKGVLLFWLLALVFRGYALSLLFLLHQHITALTDMIHLPAGIIM